METNYEKALYEKRATAVALHVQSTGSQILFCPHAMSSPTNQVEEQEYLYPGGRSTLKELMMKRIAGHN